MSPNPSLPALPQINKNEPTEMKELKKQRYLAELEVYKARQQAEIDIAKERSLAQIKAEEADVTANLEREKAGYANEYTLYQAVYNAYIEIAKGQVNVPGTKADFVQKAAAAISTAYLAVVGLSFGLGETSTPLPLSGILPTLFLGLSIFFSTAYIAYITKPSPSTETSNEGTLAGRQFERRKNFLVWTQSSISSRKLLLHIAVVSLGFAVFYLPAPYIAMDEFIVFILAGLGLVCSILIPIILSLPTE